MKDYMFAPGRTAYDRGVRDLFRRRAETELIVTSIHPTNSNRRIRIRRLEDLFLTVNFDSDIDRPLRKVFIGTHGNDSGWMQIQFARDIDGDGRQDSNTTYEILEEASTTNAYHFEDSAKNNDTAVNIRGCLIGQDYARPFLEKLKEVLGDDVPVSAPKHYHVVHSLPNAGHMEYFGNEFTLAKLQPFRGRTARNDLIQAYKDANMSFLSPAGQAVDDSWWDIWVPRNVRLGKRTIRHRINFDPPILPRRGRPITRMNLRFPKAFRAIRQRYRFTVTNVNADPGNQAARIAEVHNVIKAKDEFKSTHDFPTYERYEFGTVQEFLDGFSWRVTYNGRRNKLLATGTRYLYTIIVPVTSDPNPTDATKNHLVFNFNPHTSNTNPSITLIQENDPSLFLTV